MPPQTRHTGQPSPAKLKFRDKLSGRGLSTDALLKKLKILHTELAEHEQEQTDVASLGAVRKELCSTSLLLHKDRGVKAYTACCLADILRLYAPDAPYTQSELRDIFQFFFKQLTNGLKGPDCAYYSEYFHLLESLSTVKSIVLVCDLPNADELLMEIFRDLFALVRREFTKKVEMFMSDILEALIDECQTLPGEALEIIMAQFMDKNARIEQPAYRLAVQVCNSTADKLQRHVSVYFSDIILSHMEEEDYDEIRTAHDLIKRLNSSCPALLHSVIPQLEEELHAEAVPLRLIATQVLGEMFSEKGGADLVKKYTTTWNNWLMRRNDRSAPVRLKFVESAKGLITSLTDMRDIIEETLQAKLMDPDDKVRAAVCKIYSQLDYEAALHHVSVDQLKAVAGRGVDKKPSVRTEALNSLGKLYGLAYPEIENKDPSAISQFSWIPNEVFQLLSGIAEVKPIIQEVVAEHILPLPSGSGSSGKGSEVDEVAWTDRLLNTMKYLDEKAINALLGLTGVQYTRPTVFDHFVDACIKNNGGVIDENEAQVTQRLAALVNHLATTFPDPMKARDDLNAFAKLNESRLYKLLKTCMDVQTDLKGLVKATNDFLKRVEQTSTTILHTMTIFVTRASLRFLNQSSIPTLLKRVQQGRGAEISHANVAANHAQTLLTFISKHCPALYKTHVSELVKTIAEEKNERMVSVCLQALAAVVRWDTNLAPTDSRTLQRMRGHVLESNHRDAKFATRFLIFSKKNNKQLCDEVVESIADGLADASPELLAAHTAVLVQFARFLPESFETKSDLIMTYLVKHLLMVPIPYDEADIQDGEEWLDENQIPDTLRAKVLALKVCRYRSLAFASSDKALELSTPVLKMLATLVDHVGSLSEDAGEDLRVMSRMRLQAAVSLLQLSTVETYAAAMTPKFVRLALMVQDSCFNVRYIFLTKLVALLHVRKLPERYNVIPFLTVLDPESEVKGLASSYVATSTKKRRQRHDIKVDSKADHLELIFMRLLHLLSHHPDFAVGHDELSDMAKYILFYLDLVGTPENVSLLYHLAMRGKTVRDRDPQWDSENFYVICDLAQELIKIRAHQRSWNITSFPGKVTLPSDIFRAMATPEAATKNSKTVFLPEETLSWLAELGKSAATKEKKERKPAPKRKAASTTNGNGNTKKPRTKKRRSTNDSDDEESVGSKSSDVDMADVQEPSPPPSDDEEEPGDEKLGRGARSRAKAKAKRQSKASKRGSSPVSDG